MTLAVAMAPLGLTSVAQAAPAASASWMAGGYDASNNRSQPGETAISAANAAQLTPKWTFSTRGDVSATPTASDGVVYFPDWGGLLHAVDQNTGEPRWSKPVTDFDGRTAAVSRVSPLILSSTVISADLSGAVFAVDKATGAKRWSTQVDNHPNAVITASPVEHDGVLYVGVSSQEENAAADPSYPCCTFRGSLVALNAATGAVLWKTYTIPDNGGKTDAYSGNAIWGSPTVDVADGLVIVGTGDNYTVPESVEDCIRDGGTDCTSDDDYFDAVVAFRMDTGAIAWSSKTFAHDTWTAACLNVPSGVDWCPDPKGPDFDFGSGGNLLTVTIGGKTRRLVGFGQKSGIYWAFDAATGEPLWHTLVGPGEFLGGMLWGTATDGHYIYVTTNDSGGQPYQLTQNGVPSGPRITSGSFAALDPATGTIVWQKADPHGGTTKDLAPPSVANGVLYVGSMSNAVSDATMYALDARTGATLWSYASGGSVVGGPAIAGGMVFWGSGYGRLSPVGFSGNNRVYAFALPPTNTQPQLVYASPGATGSAAGTSCATATVKTINAAISKVASGGRVVACAGTYKENVVVTKPLSLEVSGNVVIDASGLINGIEVAAPNVTVSGFTVQNAIGEGILVKGVNNATLSVNIVSGNNRGTGSAYYIACVTPGDCGGGIHLIGSSGSKVVNNTVRGNAAGIVLSDETGPATGNLVSGNSVQDNAGSGGVILAGRNQAAAPGGVRASGTAGVQGNTITANTVTGNGLTGGGGGIVLSASVAGGAVYGNTVTANTVSGNGDAGVTVVSQAGQDLGGNLVNGSNTIGTNNVKAGSQQTTGVRVATVSPLSIQVTGNNIANDHFGIRTTGPVTVSGAAANTFTGVDVSVSAA
ncbi:PQQ-binding-like beta-propeller repeat protein [Actinoplanes sp. TBRC 11911]|uniref:outer membrane protein assembly factor BamB family protein n=1 Tax=Actinoplanes sp. TBRC 11911 TaxID=2729386 RepID=UPI00145DD511|nr:PQQ-binding-like beta-propeller repeat protein [Actinoplanes sp. TBRC 11911]NMO53379.1 PQQ-binding-like beta-propeller repeat protein [Actinoplanes sp. TBRC 11911]